MTPRDEWYLNFIGNSRVFAWQWQHHRRPQPAVAAAAQKTTAAESELQSLWLEKMNEERRNYITSNIVSVVVSAQMNLFLFVAVRSQEHTHTLSLSPLVLSLWARTTSITAMSACHQKRIMRNQHIISALLLKIKTFCFGASHWNPVCVSVRASVCECECVFMRHRRFIIKSVHNFPSTTAITPIERLFFEGKRWRKRRKSCLHTIDSNLMCTNIHNKQA